ncbi:hypothetical protein Ddc_13962 [Ditylenchus destructor]|nr:hypothetical protein Ddc_13962 [Ditylenchus destructor]
MNKSDPPKAPNPPNDPPTTAEPGFLPAVFWPLHNVCGTILAIIFGLAMLACGVKNAIAKWRKLVRDLFRYFWPEDPVPNPQQLPPGAAVHGAEPHDEQEDPSTA